MERNKGEIMKHKIISIVVVLLTIFFGILGLRSNRRYMNGQKELTESLKEIQEIKQYLFQFIKNTKEGDITSDSIFNNEESYGEYGLWFVIIGSHLEYEDAFKHAEEAKEEGFNNVTIYEPYMDNEYYGVMVGDWLPETKAKEILKQAKKHYPDTYLWTFHE